MSGSDPLVIGVVGAGPSASSLLERLVANLSSAPVARPIRVVLIDPHRPGSGRVWSAQNHPGLWMNSLARDVTMFTDDTSTIDGPIRPGPTLEEWAAEVSDEDLVGRADADLTAEIRGLSGTSFPSRRVQSAYLDWFFAHTLADLPDGVRVLTVRGVAVDLHDIPGGRQRIDLADGGSVEADAVVLALGHLDAQAPEPPPAPLLHIPAGHTAELEWGGIESGEPVIVRGFGQAFTDLVVLLTEGRGGRFETDGEQTRYSASGDEPILFVGSRRGVPYRSKIDYERIGPRAQYPHALDRPTIARLLARAEDLDFGRDVAPLIRQETEWGYYHELFLAHPDRTTLPWNEFAAGLDARPDDASAPDGLTRSRWIAAAVPDPRDILDFDTLDQPFAGRTFAGLDELGGAVEAHIREDLARRTDPSFSADLGAFEALLSAFTAIGALAERLSPRSRVEDLSAWLGRFSYFASGPPPARLRQLLALADAGVVRFVGPGMTVTTEPDGFVAGSSAHPETIRARVLVDARIAAPTTSRSRDRLLRTLFERGEVVEEIAEEGAWQANTGKVVVRGSRLQPLRADGSSHPRRYAVGVFTSRPAAGTFSRPRTNAPSFRQNDAIARHILDDLGVLPAARYREVDDIGA
ncbi:FAD/NAD(P)-binding protein [Millisia brevis]|uniref:FAD/NAD(P)-binding protein n=1 Tax=Millisia brevis TaxID=264148 RepID=UPI00082DEFFD|nr:FAD/NAD(P)-binding protein [Millisia brevis]